MIENVKYYMSYKGKYINSINYMKLLCAFLVVAIHTYPFKDINNIMYYFFSQVLVRIAVPFFSYHRDILY